MRNPLRGALLLLFLGALAGPAGGEDAASEQARIFLSWHAPWGQPGATTDLSPAPGDTTQEDTLYLTCDPATDSPTFNGFTADLYFRAAAGDSLEPYWRFGRGMENLQRIRAVFDADSTAGAPAPWKRGGFGAIHYEWTLGAGRLQLIFAVPGQRTGSARYGHRYCLARLLFRRPSRETARAAQPVCLEWSRATMALMYGHEPEVVRGERFATIHSPDGSVCAPHRRTVAPPVWKPPRTR